MTAPSGRSSDREIVVSRIVEGPQHLVFEVFSDASHVGRWWGPNGFSITTHAFDFSPGGEWDFTMHGPDGTDYPNWIRWLEISPPEHIVLRHGVGPDDPEAFTSTITLVEMDGGTEVTLRSEFQTKSQKDRAVEQYDAIEGGTQTLGRLASYLENVDDPRHEGGT